MRRSTSDSGASPLSARRRRRRPSAASGRGSRPRAARFASWGLALLVELVQAEARLVGRARPSQDTEVELFPASAISGIRAGYLSPRATLRRPRSHFLISERDFASHSWSEAQSGSAARRVASARCGAMLPALLLLLGYLDVRRLVVRGTLHLVDLRLELGLPRRRLPRSRR